MLKFLHCADLHLDSPFKGLEKLDPDMAQIAVNSTFTAFNNLIETALSEQVDFVLVAGDVFDSQDKSLRAVLKFRQGLLRLAQAGIHSFVVYGNHDPLTAWIHDLQFPPEVFFFPTDRVETVAFEKEGTVKAKISGIGFRQAATTKNLAALFKKVKASVFRIGLMHANVGGQPGHDNYAPCTLADLEKAHIDYWALGHVHTRQVLKNENPCVVYPGNIQGRHVNETGERGCYLVEVDNSHRVNLKFVSLQSVVWHRVAVDCNNVSSTDALLETVAQQMESELPYSEDMPCFFRLKLEGRSSLFVNFQDSEFRETMEQELREMVISQWPERYLVSLDAQLQPAISLGDIAVEESFRRDVLDVYKSLENREQLMSILASDKSFKHIRKVIEAWPEGELENLLETALNNTIGSISESDS